jgi:hypothetical protein
MQGPGKVLFPQVGGSLSGCSRTWPEITYLARGGGCTQRKEKK